MEFNEEDRKKLQEKLGSAEKKLRKLYDKRDGLNEEANFLRKERDSLNDRKRVVIGEMRRLRDRRRAEMDDLQNKRDTALAPYRLHRDRFNAMVQVQKKKRKGFASAISRFRNDGEQDKKKTMDPVAEINMLNMEMQSLILNYETTAMSRDKELEAMEKIKELKTRIDELEGTLPAYRREQMEREKEVIEKEQVFTDHDMTHQDVLQLSQKAQEYHQLLIKEGDKFKKELDTIYNKYQFQIEKKEKELDHVSKEADKKHRGFVALKERADHFHQKAVKFREEVGGLRKVRNEFENGLRKMVEVQNMAVAEQFDDEEKHKEAAQKAMELLKKGGKISL